MNSYFRMMYVSGYVSARKKCTCGKIGNRELVLEAYNDLLKNTKNKQEKGVILEVLNNWYSKKTR